MFEICARKRIQWNEETCILLKWSECLKDAHENGCPGINILVIQHERVFEARALKKKDSKVRSERERRRTTERQKERRRVCLSLFVSWGRREEKRRARAESEKWLKSSNFSIPTRKQ